MEPCIRCTDHRLTNDGTFEAWSNLQNSKVKELSWNHRMFSSQKSLVMSNACDNTSFIPIKLPKFLIS